MYPQGYGAFRFECESNKPSKLIGYHSNVPWTTATYVGFIIHIHTSTNT